MQLFVKLITVKSFDFVGMKFRGLMISDMFVGTWMHGFQIICKSK